MASKKRSFNPVDDWDRYVGASDFLKSQLKNDNGMKWLAETAMKSANQKAFMDEVLDVLSEGEVSSMYPNDVWEPAAKRILMDVFAKSKAKSKMARTADSKIPRVRRK
jgi:hypothetical protein